MKMELTRPDTMLLVLQVGRAPNLRLIERAAFVAKRKCLEVLVYCPAISHEPDLAHDPETGPENQAKADGFELALEHAHFAVNMLRRHKVNGRICVDSQQSALRGAMELIASQLPELMMISSADYTLWSDQSLTEGALLADCPVPVWVENDAQSNNTVLGAIELDFRDPEEVALDDRVANTASRTAADLGANPHVVHTLNGHIEIPLFVGHALPSNMIDKAHQDLENAHVRRAHDLARRYEIASENVHMERGELTDAIAEAAKALAASVVVMGASNRGSLSRLLFESPQSRVLESLHADVLIVNRNAA